VPAPYSPLPPIKLKSEHDGHGSEENHRRAMHGEQPVKGLGRDQMIVRNRQLGTHDRGFHPANHQEQDAVAEVHHPKLFVIDRDNPVVQHLDQRPRTRSLRRNYHRSRHWLGIVHQLLLAPSAPERRTFRGGEKNVPDNVLKGRTFRCAV